MLDRGRERVIAPPIAAACALEVVSIFVAVPVAALSVAVPPWHGEGLWGGGWATVALASAILAVVSMLAGTVWLCLAGWMAEVRSRSAWTANGIVTDECSSVPLNRPDQQDRLYPRATLDNQAVWAVLRAHRHSIPSNAVETVTDMAGTDVWVAAVPSVPSMTELAGAAAYGAEPISTDNGCDPTQTPAVGTALRVVSADSRPALQVRKAFPSRVTVMATRGSKARPDCGARLAIRARRIASGSQADAWPNSYPTVRVMGLPIKITSNIIVRAQGDDGLIDGERLARPKLDSDRIRAGPSATASIAGSTGPAASRERHGISKRLDATTSAEAKRQVIALAEALARQAAREDDAAEHVAERSASLDADTVGGGRDSSDRDDTG